jgi:hypothetical protein
MKWLARMTKRDRCLLMIAVSLIAGMVVLLGIFGPEKNDDDPVPTSWGTGNHGAKAAYLTLGKIGYSIERWTEPLSQLADRADSHTVLIVAEPFPTGVEEQKSAVEKILKRGGRVLATGIGGAMLLPHSEAVPVQNPWAQECHATPVGLDAMANADDVRMYLKAYWAKPAVGDRTQYLCGTRAVIVTYAYDKGEVIWWADALPLENRGIAEGANLELLLSSIGPAHGATIYWDESLHGEAPSLWSYAKGTPVRLGVMQLFFAAALLLLSFGRRSGPVRPDPKTSRASASEFVRSLGGLFEKAHATHAVVAIAYQHLRRQMHLHLGVPATVSVQEASEIASRRMQRDASVEPAGLLADLELAESVTAGERIPEAKALKLVRALDQHEQHLRHSLKGR